MQKDGIRYKSWDIYQQVQVNNRGIKDNIGDLGTQGPNIKTGTFSY